MAFWKDFKVNALKQEVWNFSKSSRQSDIVKFLDPLNSWCLCKGEG